MKDYEVKIAECSNATLSAREKLMLKDTSNAIHLDEACADAPLFIKPAMYAVLDIHNEKGEDKDYQNYLVVDAEGTKYVTGSASFWKSFIDIFEAMSDEGETDYMIQVFKLDSKNYKGKQFITCSIV